jgi:hypothetical protein
LDTAGNRTIPLRCGAGKFALGGNGGVMRGVIVAVSIALMLGGCSTTYTGPTDAEREAAWNAANVPPANYKSDVLAYMRTYLNDPTHVREAAISPPVEKVVAGTPGQRYVSCVRYNARRSDGKYGGEKTGVVMYANGRLDRFFDAPLLAKETCKDAAYQPFPELESLTR